MRKLATIRKISEIRPIIGADAIECAVVDGWTVVVKKGEYKAGDVAIYVEVDAWIPTELAPFLSKGQEPREYNGVKGERLRTVKLRGQLSQGLLLPIENTFFRDPGTDVTESLNIQKWEAQIPAQLAGVVKGPFPTQIPKTDEERIQNLTNEWATLSNAKFEVTEKMEGSSMTVGLLNGEFIVCSRNLNLKESEGNTLWAVARKLDLERKLRDLQKLDPNAPLDNIVLQGELVGEGIQGNHYQLRGQDFYVFAIYNAHIGKYLTPPARRVIAKHLGLNHVPVIHEELNLKGMTVEQVLAMADGQSQLRPEALREGLVFKQVHGEAHFKAVSNRYLLKHG